MGSVGIIAGSVFILIGTVLIFIFVWERVRTRDISKWPHVRGKVIQSEVVPRFSDGNAFEVVVGYRYSVEGVELEGVGISQGSSDPEKSESAAKRKASRFPVGRGVEVFYNPGNPQESCLLVRAVTFNVAFIVGGAIFAGAGFFLVMVPPGALKPKPVAFPPAGVAVSPPIATPARSARDEPPGAAPDFRVTSVGVTARVISGEMSDAAVQNALDLTTLVLRGCLNQSRSASAAGDWVFSLEVRPSSRHVQHLSAPVEDDTVTRCLSNALSGVGLPRSDKTYQIWATVTVE